MSEDDREPLAKTRSRRSNAGARMHEMMFAAEDDEILAQAYGGLLKADDSSDDEEYVPKDLETAEVEGEIDASDSGDESSGSDEEDEDEDEAEGEGGSDDDPMLNNGGSSIAHKNSNHSNKSIDIVKKEPHDIPDVEQQIASKSSSSNKLVSNFTADSRFYAKVCSVCLGEQVDEDDEIIECDACGVSVHEGCYGVLGEGEPNDDASVHSNISSESTEPWFCDPCKRSVTDPYCELCPNKGGIFKQTDTGRWIHMVCALYTRGITFENIETLSEVSLFELNYSLYGSKACTLCEDARLARSGVSIGCDAGLCKTFFHATCAQREGLLFESHSDEVDPFFAHCKQHADKTVVKSKKKLYLALHARLKRMPPLQSRSDRIKRKLREITQQPDPHLTRWSADARPPVPPRSIRMLLTSPSLILRLTKKSELRGLDTKSAFMNVQDEIDMARQKWHIPPAFSLEFVAYCRDRTTRVVNMKKQHNELVRQNSSLKTEESALREKYNSIKDAVTKIKIENEAYINEARALQRAITASTGKQFSLPIQMEQLIARCSNIKTKNAINKSSKSPNKTSTTHRCGKCDSIKDQHLLSLCDTCHSYLHIYCLDPPLTRVPKKTKFGGWQCSDCSEKGDEEQEEALEEQSVLAMQDTDGPRRLRERIRIPDKFYHESIMASFWTIPKKRAKKSSKSSKSKRPKAEV